MNQGLEFYLSVDRALAATVAGDCGFTQQVQTSPARIPASLFLERQQRLVTLRGFLEVVRDIFREVVAGKGSDRLLRLLLNDVPDSYGVRFHRGLPSEAWTVPAFFRTDESGSGQILEIQCPGSGWGDLQLLADAYSGSGDEVRSYKPSLAIAEEIMRICGGRSPSVLHLLDNSSNPASMRYLIATTQPPLRYWGYERSVENAKCDFVRSHSFFGLVAENLFKERLRDASLGRARFDLPPVLVFDQKIPLCLPFLEETRDRFSDAVRSMLVYSYPVLDGGFRDERGEWVGADAFASRPSSQRRYFLKYAGCDVSANWGSRAVFRLDDGHAESRLTNALRESASGRFWLIQPEVSDKEQVRFFQRSDGREVVDRMTVKHSSFYGPTELIGIKTMHRKHYKVHGQSDTVVGLGVPGR